MIRSPHLLRAFLVAGLAVLPASIASAQEQESTHLENMPTFDSTSNESVLLRYKMKTGQVMKLSMDMDVDVKVRLGFQEIKMKQTMHMDAKAAVTAVDGKGNAISLLAKITRMQMKMSGQVNLDFDSDKSSDDPRFKAVAAMINVGIPCKMSPVGKMLETDLEPLRLAVRRAGDAALAKSLEDSTGKMFDGTFVQLCPTPIKVGDGYTAGTIVEDKLKIHMQYKVVSVSGDKSKAVLEPAAVLEATPDAFPGVDAKIKSQKVAGWLLYDVENGYPSKADVRMHIVLEVSAEGQTGTVDITGKTQMTATLD